MRATVFIALMALMQVSSALGCSIDEMKKLADDHLERLPSSPARAFADPDPSTPSEGGGVSWQIFERASGVPHSIVTEIRHELGQDKIRISFLSRRDFVISETKILYAERVMEKEERTAKYLTGPPNHYFFCDEKLQIPAGMADPGEITRRALYWKEWIFKADELKPELQRIPE
jgi:hypothetical protein